MRHSSRHTSSLIVFASSLVGVLLGSNVHASPLLKSTLKLPKLKESVMATANSANNSNSNKNGAGHEQQPAPTPIPSILGQDFTDSQINSCLVSMCGQPATNIGAYNSIIQREAATADDKTLWVGQLIPALKIALTDDQNATTQMVNRINQLLSSGQTPRIGHPMQALTVFQALAGSYVAQLAPMVVTVNQKTLVAGVDEAKLTQLLNTIKDTSVRGAVSAIFDTLYRPLLQEKIDAAMQVSPNTLAIRLKVRYPKLSSAQALKTDAQKVLTLYGKIQAQIGKLLMSQFIDDTEITLFTKAAAGTDLNIIDSQFYVSTAEGIETANGIFNGGLSKALMLVQLNPVPAMQKLISTSAVAKKLAQLQSNSLQKRYSNILNTCIPRLDIAMASTATPAQYAQLQTAITAIKATAKSLMPKLAVPAAVPMLNSAIDNVGFMMPEPTSDYAIQVEDSLALVENRAKESLAELAAPTDDLDQVLLWTAPSILALPSDPSAGPDESMVDVCNRLPDNSLTDYTLTAQGQISVSWFSAAYIDIGVGVVSHEMGHVVSANIRKLSRTANSAPPFLSTLNCLADRNPFVLQNVSLGYQDNTTWSEEDWADHFSSLVLNAMQTTGSPWEKLSRNMGCAMLDDDGKQYLQNTYQPAQGDIHSAPLFRMMMVGIDRTGAVPASCQPFLAYSTIDKRPLNCQ